MVCGNACSTLLVRRLNIEHRVIGLRYTQMADSLIDSLDYYRGLHFSMGSVPFFVPETDESKLQVAFGLFHPIALLS